MSTFLKRAAHSVNHMCPMLCLFVALVVSDFGFEGRTLVLIALFPGHYLPFTNFITMTGIPIPDIFKMSPPVEAAVGCETLPEERDITSLLN